MKFIITEDLVRGAGGAFSLSSLLQKRLRELVRGAPRLIQDKGAGDFEVALREAEEGLIKPVHPEPKAKEKEEKEG